MMIWAPSSEFVSSSIPSWQFLTAHAQPFRGARDLVFCLKVPLDSLLVWASSGGSGETARMRRLTWTFAARISDKYQTRLARPKWSWQTFKILTRVVVGNQQENRNWPLLTFWVSMIFNHSKNRYLQVPAETLTIYWKLFYGEQKQA